MWSAVSEKSQRCDDGSSSELTSDDPAGGPQKDEKIKENRRNIQPDGHDRDRDRTRKQTEQRSAGGEDRVGRSFRIA
jgi:hypothetical protein